MFLEQALETEGGCDQKGGKADADSLDRQQSDGEQGCRDDDESLELEQQEEWEEHAFQFRLAAF